MNLEDKNIIYVVLLIIIFKLIDTRLNAWRILPNIIIYNNN